MIVKKGSLASVYHMNRVPVMRPLALFAIATATLLAPASSSTAQPPPGQDRFAPDAFLDPAAREIYTIAYDEWDAAGANVLRYTARIEQRIAAGLRTPLRDRTFYHSESAVRSFWQRDRRSVIQVLGSRSEYPGRSIAIREAEESGILYWLQEFPFEEPFAPGSDQLFIGADRDAAPFQPSEDEFWLAHPLGQNADTLYRFRSGDTTTVTLQDGRQLVTVRLDVLPREIDPRRISGSLWIEPESGALVRGLYRLSRPVNLLRDIPEAREDGVDDNPFMPGFLKPITFEMRLIVVDYSLWDFKAWLPRAMHLEGEMAMGIFKVPVRTDAKYTIESVTLQDEAGAEVPEELLFGEPLTEVNFDTRAEAMAFIAQLLSEDGGTSYAPISPDSVGARRSRWIAPGDHSIIENSPDLPPPIWEYEPGLPSDEEIERYVSHLASLPVPPLLESGWNFDWGWSGRDMLRYNRVEALAVGGGLERSLHGSYRLTASGYFGVADLRPKARLDLERSTVLRRLKLGAYHELRPTEAESGYLGLGNSLDAFFFGRDNGEYYYATGADLTWRPPAIATQSFQARLYAERQSPAETSTNFALFRAFNRKWDFRPNVAADEVDEAGAEVRLSPWWGNDPVGARLGLELFGRGAVWRAAGVDGSERYGQASATLRTVVPVQGRGWRQVRLGIEAAGGHTWGEAPVQRSWFLGAGGTLRGYPASTLSGMSFVRGRVELARTYEFVGASVFGDAGWAGPVGEFDGDEVLYGVGVGLSILDGLVRFDLSQGLKGPKRDFRVELYLDHIL